MGAIELLDEMRILLNIPQFQKFMFHKLEELKKLFEEEVNFLMETRRKFQKSVYGTMEICTDADQEENFQAFYFEALRLVSGKWWTKVEPLPPPGYDIHDVIPDDIIQYINSTATVTRKTNTIEKFSRPNLQHIAFDLKFLKYSDEYIFGNITPRRQFIGPMSIPMSQPDAEEEGKIYQYNPNNRGDESNFQELQYYMKAFPALKAYIFTELHMRLKPLVLSNMVDFTAVAHYGDRS